MPFEAPVTPLPANDILPLGDRDPGLPEACCFQPVVPCTVQDLVDAPCRALEVEYKGWRNLDHADDRAELARDVAALANHGGGYILFGFDEDSLAPEDTDSLRTQCTDEKVAGIVRAYLDPPVSCDVSMATCAKGVVHPVIRVPSHGATPVCVRQDGPMVGSVRLIERGAFYIRKHGTVPFGRSIGVPRPQSSRIEGPPDWAALIRRCVRRDREALLAMLDATIEGRARSTDTAERLLAWHKAARSAFLSLVPQSPVAESLGRRHYALSYAFDLIRPEMLDHAQLPERLRSTVFDVQTYFRSGWNMFDQPYRRDVCARFVTDPATGDEETDFLETAWLRARVPTETADFWRVSPCGLATIIRSFAEDTPQSGAVLIQPGSCLSVELLTQEVAELVWHASAFARLFGGVRHVAFRCEWWGLAGRELFDPDRRWPYNGPALGDHCVATVQVPTARLGQGWPDVVAQLIAPVIRAVEPSIQFGALWVREQMPRWAEKAG